MVTPYDENLDGSGRIILWITFALMAGSAVGFAALGATKPMNLRSHAFVSTGIVSFAAAAYYALATNSGKTSVAVEPGSSVTRAIFYARYIDWFFTTPLLLVDILLIAGVSFGTTLWILFSDVAMIVLGLFGAITPGKYKWGWYGAGCLFQLFICYGVLVPGTKAVRLRSPSLLKYYWGFSIYLLVLWLGYPIVWGLAEGSNTITADAEAASYAGLDIAAKVLFGWALMLCTPVFHRVQIEQEKTSKGGVVNALTTPINDLWGTSGISSAVPSSAAHTRTPTEYDGAPTATTATATHEV